MTTPKNVLDFWFSDDAQAHWFKSTQSFDSEIQKRFEALLIELAKGPFPHPTWEETPTDALALIIVLDQFPRNIYRGSSQAFAYDSKALAVASRLVDQGWDLKVPTDRRSFIYMPFMHAENLSAQNRCVELVSGRLDSAGSTLRHAKAHRDVIDQFGRFPHRNDVLKRDSTPEERLFLETGGYDPS